jgi:hypothetical protein
MTQTKKQKKKTVSDQRFKRNPVSLLHRTVGPIGPTGRNWSETKTGQNWPELARTGQNWPDWSELAIGQMGQMGLLNPLDRWTRWT